jgi:hypothetical protein
MVSDFEKEAGPGSYKGVMTPSNPPMQRTPPLIGETLGSCS